MGESGAGCRVWHGQGPRACQKRSTCCFSLPVRAKPGVQVPFPQTESPQVGVEVVRSLEDVQRFYILLEPKRSGAKSRLIIVGKKRLPDVRTHEVARAAEACMGSWHACCHLGCDLAAPAAGRDSQTARDAAPPRPPAARSGCLRSWTRSRMARPRCWRCAGALSCRPLTCMLAGPGPCSRGLSAAPTRLAWARGLGGEMGPGINTR